MRDAIRESHTGLRSLSKPARDGIWIALVAGSSILFSLALACATPFAAIATVAGGMMARRDAVVLVGIAWLANQGIGYLVLDYPLTLDSFAWGGMIGVATLLATLMAGEIARRWPALMISLTVGYLAAFATYELIVFAATAFLPSVDGAFSLEIVARIFGINLLALAGLLVLYRAAVAIGLLARRPGNLSGAHA